jgi:hypothetical protein
VHILGGFGIGADVFTSVNVIVARCTIADCGKGRRIRRTLISGRWPLSVR